MTVLITYEAALQMVTYTYVIHLIAFATCWACFRLSKLYLDKGTYEDMSSFQVFQVATILIVMLSFWVMSFIYPFVLYYLNGDYPILCLSGITFAMNAFGPLLKKT